MRIICNHSIVSYKAHNAACITVKNICNFKKDGCAFKCVKLDFIVSIPAWLIEVSESPMERRICYFICRSIHAISSFTMRSCSSSVSSRPRGT